MNEPRTARGPLLPAALCFIAPLILYVVTAARTVQGGDTGEFGLLGMNGGVAHPPGYPLYEILARLFGALPITPLFFRISMVSVLCGAAAVLVVQRVGWRLTGDVWASTVAALAFAVTPIFWRLSGVPEVFCLHALMVALAMLFSVRVAQATTETRLREIAGLGLVAGLGLANHLTIVLCAPLFLGVLAHTFRNDGPRAGVRALAVMAAMTVVGLLPYLLLMSWAHADPSKAIIWGRTGTFKGLVHHFLRKEYGTFSLHADKSVGAGSSRYVIRSLRTLVQDYVYVFFAAGLVGGAVVLRARKASGIVLLVCLFLSAVVFPSLITFRDNTIAVEVAERFFIMPLVLFAPFVAWGLAIGFQRFSSLRVVAALTVVLALAAGWQKASWRKDTIINQYTQAIVKNLPPNSVIIGKSDAFLFAMEWRRAVLNVRPDVQYLDPYSLRGSWYYERIRGALPGVPVPYDETDPHVADLGNMLSRYRPTFYLPFLFNDVQGKVPLQQWGLLYKVTSGPAPTLDMQRDLLARDTALLGHLPEPADAWSTEVVRGVVMPWSEIAEGYKKAGREADAEAANQKLAEVLPPGLIQSWAGE